MPADKTPPELVYETETVPSEYWEPDGSISTKYEVVFKGISCKRCKQPVQPPKEGWQPRCLNPDCRSAGALRAGGLGRKPKCFSFSYADLAQASGLSEGALRARVCRKRLDPRKFASVAALLRQHTPKENP